MELAGCSPNMMTRQPSSEGHASWQRRELFGLQQPGLHFAGLHVPVGRLQVRTWERGLDGVRRQSIDRVVALLFGG